MFEISALRDTLGVMDGWGFTQSILRRMLTQEMGIGTLSDMIIGTSISHDDIPIYHMQNIINIIGKYH